MQYSEPKTLGGILSHLAIALLALTTVVVGSSIFSKLVEAQSSSYEFAGYAWSSDAGWISFSSLNCDKNGDGKVDSTPPGCPAVGTSLAKYRVSEDPATGALSGYAWSANIGWITFDASKLTGCPSGVCSAQVNLSTGTMSGWARACGAFALKDACTGSVEPQAGGWDGWIHLLGTTADGSRYSLSQGSDCKVSGYAWGSTNLGWIHFGNPGSGTSLGYNVYIANSSSPACTITIADLTTCPVGSQGTFPNCTCLSGYTGTYPDCTITGACPPGQSGTPCVGTTVLGLDSNIYRVRSGSTVTLTWSVTNVMENSCVLSNNSGWTQSLLSGPSGVGSVTPPPILGKTIFTLSCLGKDSARYSKTATILINIVQREL